LETSILDQESDLSSPDLSSDSQESFQKPSLIDDSTKTVLSTDQRAKSDYDDTFSLDKKFNNLSDSTCLSEGRQKRQIPMDLFSEFSSINDQTEPLRCVIPSSRHEANIFGSSPREVESGALSTTYTADSQFNGELGSLKFESRPSSRRADIDKDEDKQSEGASSVEVWIRKSRQKGAEEGIELHENGFSAKFSFLSPGESDNMNTLFNFSDGLDTHSSASEKQRRRSTKREKPSLSPHGKNRMRNLKLRGESSRIRQRDGKASRSHFWSDSSDEDILDFEAPIGSKTPISPDIKAEKQVCEIGSSEDSQMHITRTKSMMIFNPKNRRSNLLRMVSESPLYNSELVKERFTDKKDPQQFHVCKNSSSTPASVHANLIDTFIPEINHLKEMARYIRDWISRIREEISTLKTDPSTFDEIYAIIGPGITKDIQHKLTEVRNLIKKCENLEGKSNSDHSGQLLTMVKECERELEKVGKDWKKKIEILPFKVKMNLSSLLDDYWKRAKRIREDLEQLQRKYAIKNHPCYKTVKKFRNNIKEMQSDNARIKLLKESVEQLREHGEFLVNIKSSETEDCLYDAMELAIVHESTSKKIQEMGNALKSDYRKQKQRKSKKNRNKAHSSFKHLELEKWSDLDMNTESQKPRKNW